MFTDLCSQTKEDLGEILKFMHLKMKKVVKLQECPCLKHLLIKKYWNNIKSQLILLTTI